MMKFRFMELFLLQAFDRSITSLHWPKVGFTRLNCDGSFTDTYGRVAACRHHALEL
jgi:hypothetical protein